jgi:hypothetical protein
LAAGAGAAAAAALVADDFTAPALAGAAGFAGGAALVAAAFFRAGAFFSPFASEGLEGSLSFNLIASRTLGSSSAMWDLTGRCHSRILSISASGVIPISLAYSKTFGLLTQSPVDLKIQSLGLPTISKILTF